MSTSVETEWHILTLFLLGLDDVSWKLYHDLSIPYQAIPIIIQIWNKDVVKKGSLILAGVKISSFITIWNIGLFGKCFLISHNLSWYNFASVLRSAIDMMQYPMSILHNHCVRWVYYIDSYQVYDDSMDRCFQFALMLWIINPLIAVSMYCYTPNVKLMM